MDSHRPDASCSSLPPARLIRYAWLVWVMWAAWLPFVIAPIINLMAIPRTSFHFWLAMITMVLFVVLYLRSAWYIARYLALTTWPETLDPRRTWGIIVTMTLLSFFVSLYNGPTWQEFFIFTIAIVSGLLHDMRVVLIALLFFLLLIVSALLTSAPWATTSSTIVLVTSVGTTATSIIHFVIVNRQLRQTREEMVTRLAVSDERLRIARDLHDLLGHNLSLIALKSELARRLVEEAPRRAADEIRDIEIVARSALREVRETISGYRQPTLASELSAAQEMLSAAAITCSCQAGVPVAHVAIEAALAWAIREGATNVIRHSRAKHCTIQLAHDEQWVSVLVTDDGVGGPDFGEGREPCSFSQSGTGSGLTGLSERVVACGGTLEAGPRLDGGFRLYVSLPLQSTTTMQGVPDVRYEGQQGSLQAMLSLKRAEISIEDG